VVQSMRFFSEVLAGIKNATEEWGYVVEKFYVLFANMSKAVGETGKCTNTIKERINHASTTLNKPGIENAESAQKIIESMRILKDISNECEVEKEKIKSVFNGLIGYISRFGNRIRKTVEGDL